jgi:hypothetical protein
MHYRHFFKILAKAAGNFRPFQSRNSPTPRRPEMTELPFLWSAQG